MERRAWPFRRASRSSLVTHWNAGLTNNSQEDAAYFAGVSLIAAVRKKFHLMLETRWTDDGRSEVVVSRPRNRRADRR